jgi:hypothetical protein
VGLERGTFSLASKTEELFEWKSSGFGSKYIEINGSGDRLRRPRDTLYPQKLAPTSLKEAVARSDSSLAD